MKKLQSLIYSDPYEEKHILKFSTRHIPDSHDTTIITGVNGSYKSSILRDIVQNAVSTETETGSSLKVTIGNQTIDAAKLRDNNKLHLIAVSGTLADRFPVKRIGGRSTDYDHPNYVYFGQRVGTNLLSKKQSIETVIYYLLDELVSERYSWKFYERIFKAINLIPRIDFKLELKLGPSSKKNRGGEYPQIKKSESLFDYLHRFKPNHATKGEYSYSNAQYMLNQFSHDAFGEWHELAKSKKRIFNLSISDQIASNEISFEAIRLGLFAGDISLIDAEVSSRFRRSLFSAFELSSGEYHFLTNILGIGFSAKDDSIILVDEPENSLHPQWQIDFMDLLYETCSFMKGGHLVVATHSPLIVSSCGKESTVIDLSKSGANSIEPKSLFGSSVDDILLDHFKIASSRNYYFVQKLQRAIDLFSSGNTEGDEFAGIISELKEIKVHISEDDPIIDLINTLINEHQKQ